MSIATAGAKTDLSSLVAASPQQMHLSMQIGFPRAQSGVVDLELLGGQTGAGYVLSCLFLPRKNRKLQLACRTE